MTRRAAYLWLLFLMLGGCAPIQIVEMFFPEKVKPVYVPQDRPALVLIDDPQRLMGDRVMLAVVADRVMHDMKTNELIGTFVPTKSLYELQDRLGDDYAREPIDRIGRSLGAEQVIYVKVRKLQLMAEVQMLRPQAQLSLKVIDAAEGQRLFPPVTAVNEPRGYEYQVQMHYRYQDEADASTRAKAMRRFAERIGRDTARCFYPYEKSPVGQVYEP